jgi:uncharacterized protein YkwD
MAVNDFFAHTGSDGSKPWERIAENDYQHVLIAENIISGVTTPDEVVDTWDENDEARANMLDCDMQDAGIGFYYLEDDSGSFNASTYWTAIFARPEEASPTAEKTTTTTTATPTPTHTPTTDATQTGETSTPTPTSTATPTDAPTDAPTSTPTSTATPTETPTPAPSLSDMVDEVVQETNRYRSEHGCSPLTVDSRLAEAAQDHARHMALNDYFSHIAPGGSTPYDRIEAKGYRYSVAAENIFAGTRTAAETVKGWYNSEGHRKNMLNCDLEEIGVGYYYLEDDTGSVNYHTYWVQVFGTPR